MSSRLKLSYLINHIYSFYENLYGAGISKEESPALVGQPPTPGPGGSIPGAGL